MEDEPIEVALIAITVGVGVAILLPAETIAAALILVAPALVDSIGASALESCIQRRSK